MKPPAAPALLLRAVAPREWCEAVLGDLEEEFGTFTDRVSARKWYRSQVFRSIGPLLAARLRQSPAALLCALAGGVLPLVLLDRLWAYAYSQIPLKASAARSPELVWTSAALIALAGCACAAVSRGGMAAGLITAFCSAAALRICVAQLPPAAPAVLFILVFASWTAGARLRRRNKEVA